MDFIQIHYGSDQYHQEIKLRNELLREPLVALESVEEAGLFKRLWHALVLFITQLVGL